MLFFTHFLQKMCQKCSLVQLRAGLCVGQSGSSPLNLLIRDFMDLVLCTGAGSCWNRKCPGMLMCYVPSTGTKEMCPTPENPSKLYTWTSCLRQVPFSWQEPKQASSIRLPGGGASLATPENNPPLL